MTHSHKEVLKQLIPVELGENHEKDLTVEGGVLDEVQASAEELLQNIFADKAFRLLPNWERLFAITPDPAAPYDARQDIVVSKLRETGGLSIPYFKSLADALGYTIEIFEPRPFTPGRSKAGDMLYVDEAVYCWRVDVYVDNSTYFFQAGKSRAGDRLGYSAGLLESLFIDLKRADSFVYFDYSRTRPVVYTTSTFDDRTGVNFEDRVGATFDDR